MANRESKVPPPWIQPLVEERKGHDLRFIMEKAIFMCDLCKYQNRLLVPKEGVDAIKGMPSDDDKMIVANLHSANGGLDVRVFPQNKFRIEEVKLRQWGSTGSSVINGREMKVFRAWCGLNVKDEIEMWGFRDGRDGKLCFAISKTKK